VQLACFPLSYSEFTAGHIIRGLYGLDFILHDGTPWPVEVNPRYTASVEILEYVWRFPALAFHRAAFVQTGAPDAPPTRPRKDVLGKAIYFAPEPLVFPSDGPWRATLNDPPPVNEMPDFADIPVAGQSIPAGRPVLTFFARAATVSSCMDALRQIAKDLDRWLFGA
jgi:predicted ATP-grasp superfamily ATP-dependent carboligase